MHSEVHVFRLEKVLIVAAALLAAQSPLKFPHPRAIFSLNRCVELSPASPSHECNPGASVVKLLIAEDDDFFCRLLQQVLKSEFELCVAQNGTEAWSLLQQNPGPMLAILDWVMPGMTGPQICREARARSDTAGTYMILLTAKNSAADIMAGLRSGADDYVTKPFQPEELRARVRMGKRILDLQAAVAEHKTALQSALEREKQLEERLRSLQAAKAVSA
jgi:phosphoserine phosphatase RsbU/P